MWPFGPDDDDIIGLLSFPKEIADVQFDDLTEKIPAGSIVVRGGRGNIPLMVYPPISTNKINNHSATCAGCGAPRIGYEINCRYCGRLT